MAKKGKKSPSLPSHAVSAERAGRLYRLVQLLATGPQTRASLARHLRLDVRGFYRDLELLRAAGIAVGLATRRYVLEQPLDQAPARLPFPAPPPNLGEAQQPAQGSGAAIRKL